MDFVDLDKVLDQFEEEEKAAGEIQPGQETKPSGYAEYLASHQDRPWESLSYAPLDPPATKQNNFQPQTLSYDDPYDSYDVSAGSGEDVLKQLGVYTNNINDDSHHNQNGSDNLSLSLEQELARAKLKGQTIESYLPHAQLTNGFEEGSGLNGVPDNPRKEEDEKRSLRLIASQPASIQTDTLSPASERELLSYPLPKSDILVVGHGEQDTELLPPSELQPASQDDMQCKTLATSQSSFAAVKDSSEGQPQSAESQCMSGDSKDDMEVVDNTPSLSHPADSSLAMEVEACTEGISDEVTQHATSSSQASADHGGGAPAEQNSRVSSLQAEMAAAEFGGPVNKPAQDVPVGFGNDCKMDSEEMDAYLRDLEESGDDIDSHQSMQSQSALPAALPQSTQDQSISLVPGAESQSHAGPHNTVTMTQDGRIGSDSDMAEVGKAGNDGSVAEPRIEESDSNLDAILKAVHDNDVDSGHDSDSVSGTDGDKDVGDGKGGDGNIAVDGRVGEVDTTDGMDNTAYSVHLTHNVDSTNSQDGGSNTVKDDSNNSSLADWKQPDVVADIGGRMPCATVDRQTSHSTDSTSRQPAKGGGAINSGQLNNHTYHHLPVSNKCETKWQVQTDSPALQFPADSMSLQFPAVSTGNQLGSVMKGKLEIEGLLDDIVAAKLANKSAESENIDVTAPAQLASQEKTAGKESSDNRARTEGWGPEGSMVCCRVRESSSESPDPTPSPAQSSSPSPTLGVGARPKDPSHLKKNRPNSLLGLSKISLSSPFSPPQSTPGPVAYPGHGEGEEGHGNPHPAHTELNRPSSMDSNQLPGLGVRHLGAPPPIVDAPAPDVSATDGTPTPSNMEMRMEDDLEPAVMRRPEGTGDLGTVGVEGVEASNGNQRPRSWGFSTVSSPSSEKTKRPTSLNLPVRQDRMGSISPDGDNTRFRKAAFVQEASMASETSGSSEEESSAVGGTDSYNDTVGTTDPEELEGAAAAAELSADAPPPSILHLNLGKIAPTWVPDADAPTCMQCLARFTFTKRRHHCRACGKIFCSTCCGHKSRLTYLENKEGRVCVSCYHVLSSAAEECVGRPGVACRSPNPNNPIEYCSTVPPTQQANARAPLPTVMVPTGVLKRQGSNRKTEPKQVMFSDGIRPGGDLTELDGSDQARVPPRRTGRAQKKVEKQQGDHSSAKTRRLRGNDGTRNPCLIPDEGLPPVVVSTDEKGEVILSHNPDSASFMAQIKNEEASPVMFAINLNLFVMVKIINLDCCVNRVVWCFTTRGMITAGQEELVVVLETLPDEDTIPRDIFCHFGTVYEEANKGNTVSNMGHTIFNQPFLSSSSHGGMLYIRSTFQCTNKLVLPTTPFLFALLLQKWETPWAKVFPIRLMLRLGAEHRYYPCPLVSIRNMKPVFYEIGHTIMNLLADFRNFQYMLQQIRGATIHMEDKKTYINFPRNRYDQVMKVVSGSNEHVMALGASFSLQADSHLVCIQNEEGNYQTQAINIQNKPRQVTGASFVVFNGALKAHSGLRAKSSIVEDGLMVQILPEMMAALKQSMKDMVDFSIPCGSVTITQPDEVVTVRWVDDDNNVNIGVKSPVDGMTLEGVESVHVHNATDYVGERLAIRWTEVFFLQTENGSSRWEPVDLSRVAETLATAVCIALTPHLNKLQETGLTKIGLRVTLQSDSVGYEAGSNGERLPDFYMNDLDSALIPVIHGAMAHSQDGPIVLELVLHVIH